MLTDRTSLNKLSFKVLGCAIEVHRALGPGLLERPYVLAMAEEFKVQGIEYGLDVAVPVIYRGKALGCGYRVDVLVEESIVVEVKSVKEVAEIHRKQLLSYLKLTKLPLGLLINFNVGLLRDGVTRMINLPSVGRELAGEEASPARRASRGGE